MADHGGKRLNAGRKPGAAAKKTREIADKAAGEGLTPLEYMLSVMRDEEFPMEVRMDAAKGAAPYIHPRLAATEHSGWVSLGLSEELQALDDASAAEDS